MCIFSESYDKELSDLKAMILSLSLKELSDLIFGIRNFDNRQSFCSSSPLHYGEVKKRGQK